MRFTGDSCLLLFAYICCIATAAAHVLGSRDRLKHQWAKREVKCEDSKLLVRTTRDTTFVRIVDDNGSILFNIDDKYTNMTDIEPILQQLQLLLFPEPGKYLYGNSSDYYIVKTPIENGLKLEILDKFNRSAFEKEVHGSNEGLKNVDAKCAHLIGFKVSTDLDQDVNHRDGYNMTQLLWASFLGEEEVAKDLIKKGADTNSPGAYGITPLLCAVLSGKHELVEYLVKHGAKVNESIGVIRTTALHAAAYKGRAKSAQILIENGANISSKDLREATPLHYAIEQKHAIVAKELIARGADVSGKSLNGWTPLHEAVAVGNEELVHSLLQKGADINIRDNENATPLILAVSTENTEEISLKIVKHLIEHHKPDVNLKRNDGKTALLIASEKGYKQVEDYLKSHGAI